MERNPWDNRSAPRPSQLWVNMFEEHDDTVRFFFKLKKAFNSTVSAMALSHHGKIAAIGFSSGKFCVCDARNFCNKYKFTPRKSSITALSFSRDTLHIASGDRNGYLTIHNVLTGNLEYDLEIKGPIKSITYSDIDVHDLLIISGANDLYYLNVPNAICIQAPNIKLDVVIWGDKHRTFFGAYQKSVRRYSLDKFEPGDEINLSEEKMKNITSMCLSHDKSKILAVDNRGIPRLLEIDALYSVCSYNDRVNQSKYQFAIFDRDDKFVLLASKDLFPMTFRARLIETNQDLYWSKGIKEPVQDIIADPLLPKIYVRFRHAIIEWNFLDEESLYGSAAEKGLMRRNKILEEKETIFDKSESDTEEPEHKYPPLSLKPCPMFQKPVVIFPDDVNYPDQLIFLPFKYEKKTQNA